MQSKKVSSGRRVTEVVDLSLQPARDRPSGGKDDSEKKSRPNSLIPRKFVTLAISRCQNCGMGPVWVIEKLEELDLKLWKLREMQNSLQTLAVACSFSKV